MIRLRVISCNEYVDLRLQKLTRSMLLSHLMIENIEVARIYRIWSKNGILRFHLSCLTKIVSHFVNWIRLYSDQPIKSVLLNAQTHISLNINNNIQCNIRF